MNVGFTGTQRGMTPYQRSKLLGILEVKAWLPGEFHHGDCVGADDEASKIARGLGYKIVLHPPEDESKRAFSRYDHIWPAKPFLVRNRDIVDVVELLIACPKERRESLRSGTWATIRYAQRVHRSLIILFPSEP